MKYQAKIDKEIVRELPVAQTDCNIEVIDNKEDVEEAVRHLSQYEVLGFDTETKPNFKKGSKNKIALLQLSSDTKCFLFRLQEIGDSPYLKEILESEKIKKIGIATKEDINRLNSWSKFKAGGFIDLQKMVGDYGIEELGLQRMYAVIFGKKISKRQQLSNWEAKELNRAQIIYAATDAWACREIYIELIKDS